MSRDWSDDGPRGSVPGPRDARLHTAPSTVLGARLSTRWLLPPSPVRGLHRGTTWAGGCSLPGPCSGPGACPRLARWTSGPRLPTCTPDRSTRRSARRTTATAARRNGTRARFLATEEEKVALLRERSIPSVVSQRSYAPRRPSSRTTTRYFVEKMPWYQEGEDDRIWIAYVHAERTLQGFETFLEQTVHADVEHLEH